MGAPGSDSLTGGGGDDQFITLTCSKKGTITDFGQSGDRDKLLFAHTIPHTRTSSPRVLSHH